MTSHLNGKNHAARNGTRNGADDGKIEGKGYLSLVFKGTVIALWDYVLLIEL